MRATHVRLGDFNYGSFDDDANAIDATIAEITTHPNYTDGSYYHNIAVVRLMNAVKFNNYIRPACLSLSQQMDASIDSAIWSGWPMKIFTYSRSLQETQSMNMRKYIMKLISTEACNEIYANQNHSLAMPMGISAQQFCAELESKARSTLELRPLEVSQICFLTVFDFGAIFFFSHSTNFAGIEWRTIANLSSTIQMHVHCIGIVAHKTIIWTN